MRAGLSRFAAAGFALAFACVGASVSTEWPSKTQNTVPAGRASPSPDKHGAAGRPFSDVGRPGPDPFATADALSFTATNEYPAVEHSRWSLLAEPFRDTSFAASSRAGDPDNDVFKWSFEDGTVLEGKEVKHTFTVLGWQEVTLTQIVVATGDILRTDSKVMVKYVRREIRQLTDKDREAFFDAMETLYRLPTAEGNAIYGKEYKGINFFVQMHLDGAGVKDCDHWHDDAGIMTHHVGYTLLFEQALQLVDPSVTIPYWEYTIESAENLSSYGESDIFAPDWFGDASPDNSLHTVDNGRWAFLPVMEGAWDYVHNPYGLLRSPWNLDGTPFVTRYKLTNGEDTQDMVSCQAYQACFTATSIAAMNNCLNGGTHGPVHIKVGGEWNNPEEEVIIKLGYSSAVPLMTKYLWRKGYLRTPSSCTQEDHGLGDNSTCRSSCPAEVYESRGMNSYDVLMDVLAVHWIAKGTSGVIVYHEDEDRFVVAGHEDDKAVNDEFWKKVLHSLCDAGHVGELFTSSAPYDPLFWVIHPTADRFLGWRRKLAAEQPDVWALDETWGYSHGHVTGETGVVCDWTGVRQNSMDMPTCVSGICGGHNADDMLPFKIRLNGKTMQMTNAEWYAFIYPDNDDLPYMYNDFTWEHCAAEGAYIGTKH